MLGGYGLETLEYVHIIVALTHERRGDVEIKLVCPSGTTSVIGATRLHDEYVVYRLISLFFCGVTYFIVICLLGDLFHCSLFIEEQLILLYFVRGTTYSCSWTDLFFVLFHGLAYFLFFVCGLTYFLFFVRGLTYFLFFVREVDWLISCSLFVDWLILLFVIWQYDILCNRVLPAIQYLASLNCILNSKII